jgi:hypothetical protein
MAGQNVTFDFLTRGVDSTAGGFRKVADNTVLAARGAKVLSDAIEKLGQKEDRTAAESKILASALRLTGDAEDRVAARAVLADAAVRKLDDSMQDSAKTAVKAGAGFGGLAGTSGMGAAITAGVALSPIVATLAVGLGGLGLAAFGVAKNQKLMAAELAPLKAQFAGFTKALQPEVLGIFNAGIKIAGGLLHDIQPVAAATGKALGGFLGQIDREFQSGTWQQFFGFMASTAAPDIKLLGQNFTDLLDALPTLLEDLQPVASGLLQITDAAIKTTGALGQVIHTVENSAGSQHATLFDKLKEGVGWLENHLPKGHETINQLLGDLTGEGKAADAAGKSTTTAGDAFKGAWPKAQSYAQWVQASAKATTNLANAQGAAVSTQLAYGNDILTSANDAQTFHDKLKASANQIGLHTQAQRDSFGAANTYIGDLARQATTAITSGHGTDAAIGAIRNGLPVLDTAKTKNRQYWQEVATLVGYLHKLELIKFINTPIHVLGTGKWSVTGTSITPGAAHGPQNIGAAPGAATGLYIDRGTGPTADDVMIRASRGELIVPANMVRAGAVDHLRGAIPGFATGGVAGSYGPGKVAGLPGWIGGRINATDTAIAQNTAQAIVNAMASAQAAAKAAQAAMAGTGIGGMGDSGARSGSAAVAQAFARSIMGQYHWGPEQWPPWLYLGNQESGWSAYAVNKSSGAYGIGQSLGHGHPYNLGDYKNQVIWMANYIRGRYGNPANAWAHERAYNWYAKGGLVPGFASGGVAGQGAAWLKAWQSRHGGGFGAAWGPTVLNQQIPEMAAAVQRAKALSGAAGLSPGQHRFWASTAADETKRLGVLGKELVTERAWRNQLGVNELGLDKQIRAAGNLPSLAGPVRGWKAQLGRDKATVAGISKMLGYSDAYIRAHPAAVPGPVLPTVTHTYGGDVANNLGTVLAAALGPFTGAARGGMVFDSGGTLRPGFNAVWNKTGRPESLIPARGGGGVHLHLTVNAPIGSQRQLEDWYVRTANKMAQTGRLSQAVRAAGR